jgi:hypothetical protein
MPAVADLSPAFGIEHRLIENDTISDYLDDDGLAGLEISIVGK